MNPSANKQDKLTSLLAGVQQEQESEVFIYGVTNRASRGLMDRINDFLIDHSAIPLKEKGYFFELLATMVRAGIPLNRSLKILTSRTDNLRLRRVVATLSYELEHGRSFAQALERFPDVFDQTERGIVRSAEAVGNLEQILFKIAANLDRKNDLASRLMGALIYPIAVLIALVIGAAVMLIVVVPRIQEIFSQSSITLPLTTRVLLGLSVILTNYWWAMVLVILFTVGAFHMYINSDEGRFVWDFKKLRIPLVGSLLRKIIVMRFVDTLGILIESGLPINQALEFVAAAVGNEVYRVKTYDALATVQSGMKLSSSLAQAPFLFPETVVNMIAVGEQSASMGEISQKIGDHYQREVDHSLKTMTTVLGPLLILFIGVTVAFFAIAVLSPIFSLSQAVQ